ncbi:hypothetical protein PInf_022736 [Phytophthora infestans]|nr:hypothetical protein PInf_022736 [Phytophthora infestans]
MPFTAATLVQWLTANHVSMHTNISMFVLGPAAVAKPEGSTAALPQLLNRNEGCSDNDRGGRVEAAPGPLSVADKVEQAELLKRQGNLHVKQGELKRALASYAKVFAYVNGLSVAGDSMSQYAQGQQE